MTFIKLPKSFISRSLLFVDLEHNDQIALKAWSFQYNLKEQHYLKVKNTAVALSVNQDRTELAWRLKPKQIETTSDVGDTKQPWKIDAALRQKNTPPDWSTLVDLPGVCVLHIVQHNSKSNMSRTRRRQKMEWHWV